MPVTVVVGGQFGSEGKGKVAHEFAKMQSASIAVRVGGANSGHTVVEPDGKTHVFRHLPSASIVPGVISVIGPGAYIDAEVLVSEIERYGIEPGKLVIHPNAVLISNAHKEIERSTGLTSRIGSTGSGTGAAVIGRISREAGLEFAEHDPRLEKFVGDTQQLMRNRLKNGERIVVEGTQGFGLSLLHSHYYPHITSRDTTAAGFISEAGLSPLDVDDIVMVIRAFPIRVAGNSGPLPLETTWEELSERSDSPFPLSEKTTVTQKVRRVADFSPNIVAQAIAVNMPTKIVMNHVDYVHPMCTNDKNLSEMARRFVFDAESKIQRPIDFIGVSPVGINVRASNDVIGEKGRSS